MLNRKQIMRLCKNYYTSYKGYTEAYKDDTSVQNYQDAAMQFQHKYKTCAEILQFDLWNNYQKSLFNAWLEDKDIKQVIREYEDYIADNKGY